MKGRIGGTQRVASRSKCWRTASGKFDCAATHGKTWTRNVRVTTLLVSAEIVRTISKRGLKRETDRAFLLFSILTP